MRNLITATAVVTACLCAVTTQAAEETTKLSGAAFINLTTIDASTTAKATGIETQSASNGYGLDLKRFYIAVDHVFDDTWSANITTDAAYASSVGNVELFVKKAYLQSKFNDALVVRVGASDTPWMGMIDGLYGYRYVEKSLNDLNGVVNTADWGLHASGKFGKGVFNYAVAIMNGGGFKNPSRSKGMDVEGRISIIPVEGLTIAVGAYSGKKGLDTQTIENDITKQTNTFSRFNLATGYVTKKFRAGVEYYTLQNVNSVVTSATTPDTDKAHAWSVFGALNFTPVISAFGRYDDTKIKPSATIAAVKEDTKKYLQLGITYAPRKNIDLAFVYKNTKTDTNYGSTTSKADEIGVFAQVKF